MVLFADLIPAEKNPGIFGLDDELSAFDERVSVVDHRVSMSCDPIGWAGQACWSA